MTTSWTSEGVLAVDPGYSALGWAFWKGGELKSGTLRFKEKDRLKEIYHKAHGLIEELLPDHVYVEDFRVYQGRKDLHKTAFVIGLLSAVCYERGVKMELIHHNTWRAKFRKIEETLNGAWERELSRGSDHSRDAVKMLAGVLLCSP